MIDDRSINGSIKLIILFAQICTRLDLLVPLFKVNASKVGALQITLGLFMNVGKEGNCITFQNYRVGRNKNCSLRLFLEEKYLGSHKGHNGA